MIQYLPTLTSHTQPSHPHLEGLSESLHQQSDSRRGRSLVELQIVGRVQDLTQRSGGLTTTLETH